MDKILIKFFAIIILVFTISFSFPSRALELGFAQDFIGSNPSTQWMEYDHNEAERILELLKNSGAHKIKLSLFSELDSKGIVWGGLDGQTPLGLEKTFEINLIRFLLLAKEKKINVNFSILSALTEDKLFEARSYYTGSELNYFKERWENIINMKDGKHIFFEENILRPILEIFEYPDLTGVVVELDVLENFDLHLDSGNFYYFNFLRTSPIHFTANRFICDISTFIKKTYTGNKIKITSSITSDNSSLIYSRNLPSFLCVDFYSISVKSDSGEIPNCSKIKAFGDKNSKGITLSRFSQLKSELDDQVQSDSLTHLINNSLTCGVDTAYAWRLSSTYGPDEDAPYSFEADIGVLRPAYFDFTNFSFDLNTEPSFITPLPGLPDETVKCLASSTSELDSCIRNIKEDNYDEIVITEDLVISEENYLHFNLFGVNNLIIRGDINSRKITRLWARENGFIYEPTGEHQSNDKLFNFTNSSNITLQNLIIDDTNCINCSTSISFNFSENLLVDQVKILSPHRHGISLSGVNGVTIQNSMVLGAKVFGIWMGVNKNSNILIKNNLIQDCDSNGLFVENVENIKIANNVIDHNHDVALFGHQGGQIDLVVPAKNVFILSNLITRGLRVKDQLGASGIEFSGTYQDSAFENIHIERNLIYDHHSFGIYVNPGFETNVKNIFIKSNTLFDNRQANLQYYSKPLSEIPTVTVSDNCEDILCKDLRVNESDDFNSLPLQGKFKDIVIEEGGYAGRSSKTLWLLGENFDMNQKLTLQSLCDPSIAFENIEITRITQSATLPGKSIIVASLKNVFSELTGEGTKISVSVYDDMSISNEFTIRGRCGPELGEENLQKR